MDTSVRGWAVVIFLREHCGYSWHMSVWRHPADSPLWTSLFFQLISKSGGLNWCECTARPIRTQSCIHLQRDSCKWICLIGLQSHPSIFFSDSQQSQISFHHVQYSWCNKHSTTNYFRRMKELDPLTFAKKPKTFNANFPWFILFFAGFYTKLWLFCGLLTWAMAGWAMIGGWGGWMKRWCHNLEQCLQRC